MTQGQDQYPNDGQPVPESALDLRIPPTPEFLHEADTAARLLLDVGANAGQYFNFDVNMPEVSPKPPQTLAFPKDEVRWNMSPHDFRYEQWKHDGQPAHGGLVKLRVVRPDFSDTETILGIRAHTFSDRKFYADSLRRRGYPTALIEVLAKSGQGISLEVDDVETGKHYYFLSEPESEEDLLASELPTAPCPDVMVTSALDAIGTGRASERSVQRADTEEIAGLQQKVEDYILRHQALREYTAQLHERGVSSRIERDGKLEWLSRGPQEKTRGIAQTVLNSIGLRAPGQRSREASEESRQAAITKLNEQQVLEDTPLPHELTWDGWREAHSADDPSTRQTQVEAIRLEGQRIRATRSHY